MPSNPQIDRQIRDTENLKRNKDRLIQKLTQDRKGLERQLNDAKRSPDTSRLQVQLANSIREINRTIDSERNNIKTLDRQIGELKRMNR